MSKVVRRYEINKRRARRNKIRKIRQRIARAKGPAEVQHLMAKLKKISPFYPVHQLTEAKAAPRKAA